MIQGKDYEKESFYVKMSKKDLHLLESKVIKLSTEVIA